MPDISQPDLNNIIQQQAQTAQSANVDGVSVSNRSLSDLIAAAKYLDQKRAATNPLRAINIFKVKNN